MKYRFQIMVEGGSDRIPVNPVYKDDLTIEHEKESGQKFFRKKINGKLSFVRKDYEYIMSQDFEKAIYVFIQRDNGDGFEDYWRGRFMRTDCTINIVDCILSVQPDTLDEYNDILTSLDKEYNLPSLSPLMQDIWYNKRPLLQLYLQGSNRLTNFITNLTWEQDATPITENSQLVNNYHFSVNRAIVEAEVTGANIEPEANGFYTGLYTTYETNNYECTLKNSAGFSIYYRRVVGSRIMEIRNLRDEIIYSNNNEETSTRVTPFEGGYFNYYDEEGEEIESAHATAENNIIYARYLLDIDTFRGFQTNSIPENDIVENNRNYRKCIGYEIDVMDISRNFSTSPTEWGKTPQGKYYLPPSQLGKFLPVFQSEWAENFSYWINLLKIEEFLEISGRSEVLLRNAYSLASVIDVLLAQFSNIHHYPFANYSQFLYGETSLTKKFQLNITPKSNILVGNYSTPATQANITLREVLDMLKNAFNCYWFVDNNQLRIEHISYFENGGSYDNTPVVSLDLTTMIHTRNGKSWAFGQDEITYEKEAMPERKEFKWMDDVTKPFSGEPIVMRSAYVQKGNIDEVNISNFTSDLDYILLNPSVISQDGFALLASEDTNVLKNQTNIITSTSQRIPVKANKMQNVSSYRMPIRYKTANVNNFTLNFHDAQGRVLVSYNITGSTAENVYNARAFNGTAYLTATFSGNQTIELYSMVVEGLYSVSYSDYWENAVKHSLQNGLLAMVKLQDNFLTYDLPCRRINVNKFDKLAKSVTKNKKSNVTFPAVEIDEKKLIKTLVGNGFFEKYSLNLHGEYIKAEIRYDTE